MQKLYLIPSTLGESEISDVLPSGITRVINGVKHYIVENERTARRFLIRAGMKSPVDELTFYVLDKHKQSSDLEKFLLPAAEHDIGLISEAGVPCIADPGSEIVKLAHQKGIRVIPLAGPSSLLLAMMASGLNGQNFAFVGYLPVKPAELSNRLRQIERRSQLENQSQIFIETPYRNNQLLKVLLQTCHPETLLCIAADITLESEFIDTRSIDEWKRNVPDLHKRPVIYILHRM